MAYPVDSPFSILRCGVSVTEVETLSTRAKRFWRNEAALRRRFVDVGHLLTGNLVSSIVGILGFLATARALGAADYGVLALTYSYVRVVGLLVGFQSWQPLIKYGAELAGEEHSEAYRSLLKFGLLIDTGAALASYIVAVGFALVFGPLVGIDETAVDQVIIFSTVLLFQIAGLPTAVLRLAGRFRLVAYASVISGAVRLVLCMAGLLWGMGVYYFVIAWAASQTLGSLVLLGLALVELRRQRVGIRRLLTAPLAGMARRFKGLWSFTIGSNIELSIRSSANEFDTLLVGMLTDSVGAGLYHIAKRLGRLLLQIGVQVQAVLYPDVARLWARGEISMFRRTVFQTEIMLGTFGVAVAIATAVAIRPLLELTVGQEFDAAGPLVIVQMAAAAMTLTGSVMRVALLAMGRQIAVLRLMFGATLVFHATALVMIPWIGPMGANIAHVVMGSIWLAGLTYAFRSSLSAQRHGSVRIPVPVTEPGRPSDF